MMKFPYKDGFHILHVDYGLLKQNLLLEMYIILMDNIENVYTEKGKFVFGALWNAVSRCWRRRD